jgi:hypothetical protein
MKIEQGKNSPRIAQKRSENKEAWEDWDYMGKSRVNNDWGGRRGKINEWKR